MKSPFSSTTIWGALIAMIANVLGMSGLPTDAGLQADTVQLIVSIISLVGGAIAIYGRWVTRGVPIKMPFVGTASMRSLLLLAALPLGALLIGAGLSGCQTATALLSPIVGEAKVKSFEQIAYESAESAVDTYHALQKAVLEYKQWPLCDATTPIVVLCHKPKQLAKLQAITEAVTEKMEALVPLIDARSSDLTFLLNVTDIVTQAQIDIAKAKKEPE